MHFRTVVVAAIVLTVASAAGLAAFAIADEARGEASQIEVDRTDQLAVETDIRQHLASDDDHYPTAYGDTIDVELEDGTELTEGEDYEYYPEDGDIEFLVDEDQEAIIEFTYDIPADQVPDDELTTLTEAYSHVGIAAIGLSFVALFLFVGIFTAKKIGVGNNRPRGR